MRAWMSLCFALNVLTLASGMVITPDAALAAGARAPNRGIPSFYRANLQRAAKTQGAVQTANRDRWRCSGTRCEGIYLSRGFGVPACQALAYTQGPVVSFIGYDSGNRRSLRLTAAQLRQCNSGSQHTSSVTVHVGRPRSPQSKPAPDTVRTRRLILIGNGGFSGTVSVRIRKSRYGDVFKVGTPYVCVLNYSVGTGGVLSSIARNLSVLAKPGTHPVTKIAGQL